MASRGLGPPQVDTAAASPTDVEVPNFPLPIGPGRIEELDEPDTSLAAEVTENLAPLPVPTPANPPTIAMVEMEEDELPPENPDLRLPRAEAPDEGDHGDPPASRATDIVEAALPVRPQSAEIGWEAEDHPPLQEKRDDSGRPPFSEEDPRDARQPTLKPIIGDEEDRDDTSAAAGGTHRLDRPSPGIRGLRPIPRPTPRRGRRYLLLAAAGLLSGLAVWGALSVRGAGSTDASLAEAPVSPENVAADVPPASPPAEAALPGSASPGSEAAPATTAEVPATAEGPVAAEAPVAPESHAPPTPAPVAPPLWLRCPPQSCERFGDLVMVNRGPLKLYSDPACKKPASGMIAAGQTVLATGTDCFAVNSGR